MAPSTTMSALCLRSTRRPGTSTRAGRPARLGRLAAAGVSALALAGVAACGGAPEPETPDPVTVTPTIEPSRTAPPEPDVPVVWPLTGVEVDEVADRPAVAVKIENTTSARPQSGLDSADVVWETVVEFEVSRLVAVFHSQVPEEIGPIRSVRPMDPLIVAPLHGLFAYSGGQSGILREVRASPVQSISHDDGAAGLYRVSHRAAPHNVYGSLETMLDQADGDHGAPPPEQFVFARSADQASAVADGESADALSFRLSAQARPSWTWDDGSDTWLRSESGVGATDASGDRLAAVNVVSVTAPHPGSGFRAQGGASVPTYDLVGDGEVLVATGGQVLEGTWEKEDADSPLRLFDADGEPLLLAPGNTWVELVPEGKGSVSVD